MTQPPIPQHDDALTPAEMSMLRWELDQKNELHWPTLPPNRLIRWLLRILGLVEYFNAIDLHITRVQRLLVLHQKLHRHATNETQTIGAAFNETANVMSTEMIPQINRQTNAISSILDRLQYYERHVSLLQYARKSYDKLLAKKIADDPTDDEQLPLIPPNAPPATPDGVDTLTTDPQLTSDDFRRLTKEEPNGQSD